MCLRVYLFKGGRGTADICFLNIHMTVLPLGFSSKYLLTKDSPALLTEIDN